MGSAGSTVNNKQAEGMIAQRQPTESPTSYRIRIKFQAQRESDKLSGIPANFEKAFGVIAEAHSVQRVIATFHEAFNVNLSLETLKNYYGASETQLSMRDIRRVFLDVSYNPSIGAIYAALIKERETLTETVWQEFQVDFQGTPVGELAGVVRAFEQISGREGHPRTAGEFAEFLLSPVNAAFHPTLRALTRFDRPISEYFIQVAKMQHVDDCASAADVVNKYAECVFRGARVVELEVSGGAPDGDPRTFGNVCPPATSAGALPTLRNALRAIKTAIRAAYEPGSGNAAVCQASGRTLQRMPLVLVLTVAEACDAATQERACAVLQEEIGSELQCPPLNEDGSIWTPLQLDSKVVLVTSSHATGQVDAEGNLMPGPALLPQLVGLGHLRMVTVHEIRPILDKAKSRKDLRRLLQGLVLTLAAVELCAHIMELSSITDMLLIHVQTSKRSGLQPKRGNLRSRAEDKKSELDTRHVVQFSELRLGESKRILIAKEEVFEEKGEEVEPLRGWRYGAQIIAVNTYGREEASLQSAALFNQHGGHGYVPRAPRTALADVAGFADLYEDFSADYARSLFVTILSACRVGRPMAVGQPFMRVYCNNGTGLKQVAITSTVEDNGCNLVWEEDFEFKFHLNDLNAAACLLFVLHDRSDVQRNELAWASVPLWGIRTGYRSVQIHDFQSKPMPGALLFLHLDWEPEE